MKTLAFLSGIVFGIGLLVSGMTDPAAWHRSHRYALVMHSHDADGWPRP